MARTAPLSHSHAGPVADQLAAMNQPASDPAAPPSPQGRVATIPATAEGQRSASGIDVGGSGDTDPVAKTSTDGGTTAQDIGSPADSVTGEASRASDGAGSVAPIQPETANEAPMAVHGDSVEVATAPLSESVDILPGGEMAEMLDGADLPPAASIPRPDATPAGAVVADPSGVTGGESAASATPATLAFASVEHALAQIGEESRPVVLRSDVRRARIEQDLREVGRHIAELDDRESLIDRVYTAAKTSLAAHRSDLEAERALLIAGLGERHHVG